MPDLVLLRHGQSQWNLENRFTGWIDVDLSDLGQREATEAGRLLQESGIEFDATYTSVLKRAIRTLWLVLEELDRMWLPVQKDWRLNERHYGDLQGLNKAETAARHGEEQVHYWRRGYDARPPALAEDDPRHPRHDRRYRHLDAELPAAESLADTCGRTLPYYRQAIEPRLREGENLLVVAHGNSLRSLVMHLDGLTPAQIEQVNIPTGIPLLYRLDTGLHVVEQRYLGDPQAAAKAAKAVAEQGKAK